MTHLQHLIKLNTELTERNLVPYISTVYGSHLYGTSTPTSDVDIRAIHLPSVEQILDGDVSTVYESSSGDYVSYSLHKFFAILMNGSVNALELLFAFSEVQEFNSIRNLYNPKWLMATHGFVTKHDRRYPNDLKAARHAYRTALMLQEVLVDGTITFPSWYTVELMKEFDCAKLYSKSFLLLRDIENEFSYLNNIRQQNVFNDQCRLVRNQIYSNYLEEVF